MNTAISRGSPLHQRQDTADVQGHRRTRTAGHRRHHQYQRLIVGTVGPGARDAATASRCRWTSGTADPTPAATNRAPARAAERDHPAQRPVLAGGVDSGVYTVSGFAGRPGGDGVELLTGGQTLRKRVVENS